MLQDSIGFLHVNNFSDPMFYKLFDSVYNSVLACKGLVLDVRANGGGTSSYGYYILQHLVSYPFKGTTWYSRQFVPKLKAGGDPDLWWVRDGYTYEPAKNVYDKPVVLLTSASTGSAADDVSAIFKHKKRGAIIGSRTAGSTGQPIIVSLPFGGYAKICSEKNTLPDGTVYNGIGIRPDIEVKTTIENLRMHKDPVLLKAIDYLKSEMRGVSH